MSTATGTAASASASVTGLLASPGVAGGTAASLGATVAATAYRMAGPAWPETLPPPLVRTSRLRWSWRADRFAPESGPEQVVRRAEPAFVLADLAFELTTAQLQAFDAWYRQTSGGVFSAPSWLPDGYLWLFAEPPAREGRGNGWWRLECTLLGVPV